MRLGRQDDAIRTLLACGLAGTPSPPRRDGPYKSSADVSLPFVIIHEQCQLGRRLRAGKLTFYTVRLSKLKTGLNAVTIVNGRLSASEMYRAD